MHLHIKCGTRKRLAIPTKPSIQQQCCHRVKKKEKIFTFYTPSTGLHPIPISTKRKEWKKRKKEVLNKSKKKLNKYF